MGFSSDALWISGPTYGHGSHEGSDGGVAFPVPTDQIVEDIPLVTIT